MSAPSTLGRVRLENNPGGLPHKARQKGWPDLCQFDRVLQHPAITVEETHRNGTNVI